MDSDNITQSEIIQMLSIYEREEANRDRYYKEKLEEKLPEINKKYVKSEMNRVTPMIFLLSIMMFTIILVDIEAIPKSAGQSCIIFVIILFIIALIRFVIATPYLGEDNLKRECYHNFYAKLSKKDFELMSSLKNKLFLSDEKFEYKVEDNDNIALRFESIQEINRKVKLINEYTKIA